MTPDELDDDFDRECEDCGFEECMCHRCPKCLGVVPNTDDPTGLCEECIEELTNDA